jgi:hypothetical protein
VSVLVDSVLRVAALCLAALFALAAAHKFRVVLRGEAAHEPLIQRVAWRDRHATAVVLVAGFIEVGIAAMLAARPQLGAVAALAVLGVYTGELRRLAPDEACRCFGALLESSGRRRLLQRNAVLMAAALVVAVAPSAAGLRVADLSGATVGAALVVFAVVSSVEALRLFSRPARELEALKQIEST